MNIIMTLFDIVRCIVAIPLLLVWLFFTLINLRFLIESIQVGFNAGPAPVTIVGGLAGSLGLLFLPYMAFGDRLALLWLPLFLDLGSAPFYLSMLVVGIWQAVNKTAWHNQPDYENGQEG